MAYTYGYWKVAYKRIIDDVPRAIEQDIVKRLTPGLLEILYATTGVNNEDESVATQLLTEDPETAAERERLKEKIASLETALDALTRFHRPSKRARLG